MADEDIRIRAELDGALAEEVAIAAREVDNLGKQAEETALQMRIMGMAAKGMAHDVRDSGAEAKRSQSYYDNFGASMDRATKKAALSAYQTDKNRSSLEKFLGIMKKTKGEDFDLGKILKVYKIPAIITGVTMLATTISSLGAAAYAGIAGLAPLAPLLGTTYPAVFAAGAQAMLVFKGALGGVAAAAKVLSQPGSSPQQIQTALDKLPPAARGAAQALGAFEAGPLTKLRNQLAKGISPGFEKAIGAAGPLLHQLQPALEGTAKVLGRLAAAGAQAAGQPPFSGELARVMASNNVVIGNGGAALGHLGGALVAVLDAFRPVLQSMSEYALRGAKFVEANAQAADSSGRLTAFFKSAWNLAKGVGSAMTDLAVGLYNVGKQAGVLSSVMGGGLAASIKQFRDWTASTAGQSTIAKWFSDAIPVVTALGRLILAVVQDFGKLAGDKSVGPLIDQIRTQVLPAFMRLSQMTTGKLGPAIMNLVTAFLDFNNALSYSPLLTVLQGIAKSVSLLAHAMTLLPGPMKFVIATLIALNLAMKIVGMGATKVKAAFDPLRQTLTGFTGSAVEDANKAGRSLTTLERAGTLAASGLQRTTAAGREYQASMTRVSALTRNVAGSIGEIGNVANHASSPLTGLSSAIEGQKGVAGAMSKLKSVGSGLMGALGGPWGLAITGATTLLGIWAAKHAAATAAENDLKNTLNQTTGAITSQTSAMVTQQLEQSGVLKTAQQAGISLSLVKAAALGDANAQRSLNEAYKAGEGPATGRVGLLAQEHVALGQVLHAVGQNTSAYADQRAAIARMNEANGKNADGTTKVAMSYGHMGRAVGNATSAIELGANSEGRLANATHRTTSATTGLTNATDRLRTARLQMLGGDIAFQASLDALQKQLHSSTHTLNIHTDAGRTNVQTEIDLANAAAGVTGSVAKQHSAMVQAHQAIQAMAEAAGMGTKAAYGYADGFVNLAAKIRATPNTLTVTVHTNTNDALTGIHNVQSALNNVHDKTVYIRTRTVGGGGHTGPTIGGAGRHGGVVTDPRLPWTIGEGGPELFRGAITGKVEIIGAHGQENRHKFSEPGVILPNEVYEAARATDARLSAAVIAALDSKHPTAPATAATRPAPARAGAGPQAGPPAQYHAHFHGVHDPAEAERLAKAAYKAAMREERERRINHGWSGGGDLD